LFVYEIVLVIQAAAKALTIEQKCTVHHRAVPVAGHYKEYEYVFIVKKVKE